MKIKNKFKIFIKLNNFLIYLQKTINIYLLFYRFYLKNVYELNGSRYNNLKNNLYFIAIFQNDSEYTYLIKYYYCINRKIYSIQENFEFKTLKIKQKQ